MSAAEQMNMVLGEEEGAAKKGAKAAKSAKDAGGKGGGGKGGKGGKGGGGKGGKPPSGAGGGGGGGDRPINLSVEARDRYLKYAMSVITSRALPDVRDGLKPVQRRILYGMWNEGVTSDAKYRKCANVVGVVMGQFHPHGDQSIYDALVRMAQEFSLRYPLVDGHGNFGSVDGDAAAAMRYTEAKLQKLAEEMLGELQQKTVFLRPNYDGTRTEPSVLPSKLPQLLMNGTTGIAVGMATNIPPHHLGELIEACLELIKDPKLETKDLLKTIKGPDFPTGGQILNSKKELRDIYESGSGSVRLRGEWKLEERPRGGQNIIVTSIPYTVNKSTLVSRIGEIITERKLPALVDVRDESTKEVRIVMELKRDSDADLVMTYLFKHTPLQTNFNVNLTCLVPTENPEVCTPRRMNLRDMLWAFLEFRLEVVTRRLQFQLDQLKARLHILEGFEKVYDALDEMIKIIRKSEGKADAAQKLIARFKLSEEQVDAILEMKLYKLARLEILVIQKELKEKRAEAKALTELLKTDKAGVKARWNVVKEELVEIGKTYEDKRRTKISGPVEEVEYNEEAFIADEDCQVVVTRDGWVKRVRELKDPTSTRMREGDELMALVSGSLKSSLIFFSSAGAAYTTRFNDIPASTGYGDPVQKLFKFDDNERVVGALSLDPRLPFPSMMVGVSKDGYGMRFNPEPLKEISTRSGRRFAKAGQGDEIVGVSGCTEKDLLGVVTKKTNALVCKVDEVNVLAGPGRGVTVIKTADDDQVMAFLCTTAKSDKELVFETTKGKTLKFSLGKYEVTGRGGKGREMSKKDEIKTVSRALDLVLLPEAPKTDKPEKKEK